ncbi:hypothetical protein DFH08DRAFT_804234 [Mycena albidolilacea]|uniref:Uncharacterized protein n=1 Tax=Mycena albidolilacea TaxID=1033008 RepID=A0AAD7EVI5_9AGAR|nr:hypothetical protein DFH08DRAFT_804234 [Mycena albidolilacea]
MRSYKICEIEKSANEGLSSQRGKEGGHPYIFWLTEIFRPRNPGKERSWFGFAATVEPLVTHTPRVMRGHGGIYEYSRLPARSSIAVFYAQTMPEGHPNDAQSHYSSMQCISEIDHSLLASTTPSSALPSYTELHTATHHNGNSLEGLAAVGTRLVFRVVINIIAAPSDLGLLLSIQRRIDSVKNLSISSLNENLLIHGIDQKLDGRSVCVLQNTGTFQPIELHLESKNG